jgi:uncharacterized protein (TIGR02246 family)
MTKRSPLNFQVWILAAALALHPACSGQRPGDQKAATAAINDIWNRYSSSLNSGDIDRWMSLWADNGVQMPPNEPPVIGKEAIRARNKGVLDRFAFNITITNDEVRVGGDWAFARGMYAATLTPKAGGAAVSIDGKYMTILARQPDGSWKIQRDIFNSNK